MAIETNTRRIVRRLERDGWVSRGGKKHEKFEHPDRPDQLVMVPRHTEISIGTARQIAKTAGWKD